MRDRRLSLNFSACVSNADSHQFVEVGEDYRTKLQKCVAPEFLPKKYGGELDWAMPCGGDIKKLNLDIPKMIKVRIFASSFCKTPRRRNGSLRACHVEEPTSSKLRSTRI